MIQGGLGGQGISLFLELQYEYYIWHYRHGHPVGAGSFWRQLQRVLHSLQQSHAIQNAMPASEDPRRPHQIIVSYIYQIYVRTYVYV